MKLFSIANVPSNLCRMWIATEVCPPHWNALNPSLSFQVLTALQALAVASNNQLEDALHINTKTFINQLNKEDI